MEKETQIAPVNPEKNQEYFNALADEISKMFKKRCGELGSERLIDDNDCFINLIINWLKNGRIKDAKTECYYTSGDKFGDYEDIKELLRTKLFDENEEKPWMTSEEWKRKLKEIDDQDTSDE